MSDDLKQRALDYHSKPTPGKLAIEITKSMETQEDLSLAYTPGVAEPVREIAKDPEKAYEYTSKGNLIAIITNGTAVLGLGDVGPLASKPVMEGKAALFKRYANIDAIDLEIAASNPEEFINTVVRVAPTFGGINLEDIKAPECFHIENSLKSQLDIPVFHDDQHGTAIVIAAGLLNALEIQNKKIEDAVIVCSGAGAAGLTAMHLLIRLGASKSNIFVIDRTGVIHSGRTKLNPYKFGFAIETDKRTLADAMEGADVFIGVSAPNILTVDMLKSMAPNPIVFAMSNPDPEIDPVLAHKTRDDLIMATGRSDFPNQVNNVLMFPFIFRGALDVRASDINMEMQVAAVTALKDLVKEPVPELVKKTYDVENLEFGPDYILPKPNDPRLGQVIPAAVSKAARDSGVARI